MTDGYGFDAPTALSMPTLAEGAAAPLYAQMAKNERDPLLRHVQAVARAAESGDWEEVGRLAPELNRLYRSGKWKYQLLGDEEEFEGLERELRRLQAYAAQREAGEVKATAAVIATLIEEIYSL